MLQTKLIGDKELVHHKVPTNKYLVMKQLLEGTGLKCLQLEVWLESYLCLC